MKKTRDDVIERICEITSCTHSDVRKAISERRSLKLQMRGAALKILKTAPTIGEARRIRKEYHESCRQQRIMVNPIFELLYLRRMYEIMCWSPPQALRVL